MPSITCGGEITKLQWTVSNHRPYSTPRYQRDVSPYLANLSQNDFVDLYRIDKHGLSYFADRIGSHPAVHRSTKGGLSAATQLIVALRYYATGNSITIINITIQKAYYQK